MPHHLGWGLLRIAFKNTPLARMNLKRNRVDLSLIATIWFG